MSLLSKTLISSPYFIIRLRRPAGSLHYVQSYHGERILEIKKWLALSFANCSPESITLKVGDTVLCDDALTEDLPDTGYVLICLTDTAMSEKSMPRRKKLRPRKRSRSVNRARKVLVSAVSGHPDA
jgi:hypothetical protein